MIYCGVPCVDFIVVFCTLVMIYCCVLCVQVMQRMTPGMYEYQAERYCAAPVYILHCIIQLVISICSPWAI